MTGAGRWTRDARGMGLDARARAAAANYFRATARATTGRTLDAGRGSVVDLDDHAFGVLLARRDGARAVHRRKHHRAVCGWRGRGAEGRESAAKGARGDPRGGTRRRRVGRTLFPPRGPVRARQERTLRPELPHHRRRAPVRAHRGRHVVTRTSRPRECRRAMSGRKRHTCAGHPQS